MARPMHMLGRNQLTTVCEKDPARCLWTVNWQNVSCSACRKFEPKEKADAR